MTDDTARADSPEQTHSPEYNRGWADGNASALDACNPVIEALQAQLAARPSGLLRAWHVEPDPRGGYLVYVEGYDPTHVDDATDALILARAKAARAALATTEPGLDVVIYGEGPKCLNRDHPAALHSHDESGGIVPRWSRP